MIVLFNLVCIAIAAGHDTLEDAFNDFKILSGMAYTPEEEEQHLKRFKSDIKQMTARGSLNSGELEELFKKSRPALMQSIADEINSQQSSWVASANQSRLLGLSYGDVIGNDGWPITDRDHTELVVANLTIMPSLSDFPTDFDARVHFRECAEVIGNVPDQGRCNTCAIVGIAATFSDRLCISTRGRFKQQLSAGYIVRCCNSAVPWSGCTRAPGCFDCAEPSESWRFMQKNGIPTGGNYSPKMREENGCWPYDYQPCDHVPTSPSKYTPCRTLPPSKTLSCEAACTNRKYKTPLRNDLHFVDKVVSVPRDINQIKAAIYNGGPVLADFVLYEDFRYYKSGIYKHVTSRVLARHALKIIGWGKAGAQDYWLAINQWNELWGESGLVRFAFGQCGIENKMMYGTPKISS